MKKTIALIFLLVSIVNVAQERKIKTANTQYSNLEYMDAVTIYERVAEKGYGTQEIFQNLGNAYYFNAQYPNAAKWYQQLFANQTSSIDPQYYYRYYQTLKSIGDTENANQYLEKFSKLEPNDPRALAYAKNKNYIDDIEKFSNRYLIEDSKANSNLSDYGPAFYLDGVVFTSARSNNSIHSWTNQPYTDLYLSSIADNEELENITNFSSKINTNLNESTAVFTKNGKTIYFTRNNLINGKVFKNEQDAVLLKLFSATLNENGKWENIQELPFNSDNYNCAHPALSPDEKTLYFASNMPGTYGESDLYKVAILDNHKYGKPVNLGPNINTPARETFPFVSADNELYFASDGHLGLGGLDIFGTKIKGENSYSKIYNLGRPLNTNLDDFAYIINSYSRLGYVSSNRTGGKGFDDIYKFRENKKLPFDCTQIIEGIVTDSKTNLIIANAKVILLDQNMQAISSIVADSQGYFTFKADCDAKYYIRASEEQYETNEITVKTLPESGKTYANIALNKRFVSIEEKTDLAKILNIPIIYFNLDKSFIRKDAANELAKILVVMEEYPTMQIDIRSHTDCRQTAKYNMALSDRRAKSTMTWLVKNGINPNRLTAKGYGESQLVNDCGCEPTNKSDCSEEQHQANRRSEFIVVKK